jgi:hypothetical protein
MDQGRLRDAKPTIPAVHPTRRTNVGLLYVGIAPNGPRSSRTVADRVKTDHRGGSIGGSTFRQSIAALLLDHLALQPKPGHDRSRLVDERPLTEYIERYCYLTTVSRPRPWEVEDDVVRKLNPPLNLRPGYHDFRSKVESARDRLWEACGLPPRQRHPLR